MPVTIIKTFVNCVICYCFLEGDQRSEELDLDNSERDDEEENASPSSAAIYEMTTATTNNSVIPKSKKGIIYLSFNNKLGMAQWIRWSTNRRS